MVVLAAVVVVVTVGLATVSTAVLRSQLVAQADQRLEQASLRLVEGPGPRPPGVDGADGANGADGADGQDAAPPPALTDDPSDFPAGFGPGSAVVRSVDGELELADHVSDALERTTLDDAQVAALQAVPADGRAHAVDVPHLGAFRAVHRTGEDGEDAVVAASTATVAATLQGYVLVQVALGAAGLAAAVVGGAWLVRRSLRPLDDVAEAAVRVSELELSRGAVAGIPRVPEKLTDERMEVGQVGAALNRMLDHVEVSLQVRHESEQQVRRFVADASHELRTPLATIRGYAELVRRAPDEQDGATARSLDRIESEAVRMTGLVEDLLLLARLDAGRPLDLEPVDVASLAVDAVMDAHAASPAHEWALALPGDGGEDGGVARDDAEPGEDALVVTGDEASLRQVLANLLANARTHTPAGTRVAVRLVDRPDAVEIEVADDGPGITPDLRPALFRRFTRGDASRHRAGGSTGLGLAIADAIVTAHGGTIAVRSATAGERLPGATGTTFTVRLPRGRTGDAAPRSA
ncbi:sensor histidine kinase [Isoptericola sp. NPDC056134]|uniref:sensor histidine kinase n=1 Tax=Isoptericola sp. NPDC056134 TaxID=3345723 RepID=UPI0035EB2DA6